jgi:hypothetical protein
MVHKYATAAVAAAAIGMFAVTATEASAMVGDPGSGPTSAVSGWPDEGTGHPGSGDRRPEYNYPNYDPRYEVPRVQAAVSSASDGTGVEVVQAGASAVGGAVVAFGAMWVYRRRHVPAT